MPSDNGSMHKAKICEESGSPGLPLVLSERVSIANQVSQIYLYSAFHNTELLHSINQDNITVFVYSWKKTIKMGRADQWYDGSFNL